MKPKYRRAHSSLASFLTVAVFSTAAQAGILYWDGATPAGDPNGGAGNWDLTTANWDTALLGGSAIDWTDNDFAVFGGTAGTVTLTDPITVGGLRFDTTGYIIDGETNTKTLSFASGDNTILFNNIAGATINGQVGGSGNVILSTSNPATAGILTLGLTSTAGWTGSTTINAGMTLLLNGANRGLSSTSGITLNGGGITLTNTNSTQGAFNRVNNTGITSNGGTFTYTNTVGAGLTYAETIGSVGLNRGQTNFLLTNSLIGGSAGDIQTLTLTDLTRTGATNTSVVSFGSAGGLNITDNIIQVTGKSGSGSSGSTASVPIIGPWAFYGTTPSAPTDYAVYDASGRVLNANISSTAENSATWTAGGNNVTLGGATVLTGTRTLNTLRYTGGALALDLGASNYNLETYGLLNGGSALTISTTGSGGLTTPTGGGNLFLTTGAAAITVSAPIRDNGGAVTVVKSGSNTLTLGSTLNTFTGGIVLNAGALTTTSNANLGIGGGVTVNGIASWNTSTGTNRSITINEGGVLTLTGASSQIYSGLLSGSGALASNTSNVYHFTNAGNSLTGEVTISYGMNFANIGDSTKAINIGNTNANAGFGWTGGAKTLASRVFTLNAAGNAYITTNGSGALVISQNLAISGTAGARTLNLQGSNTAINTFSGNIADGINGGTSVVTLTKAGSGTWALGGTNTYSGDTNLSAVGGSTLIFQGSQSLSSGTKLLFAQNSSAVASVRFLDDGGTPGIINFNRPIEFGGNNTSQVLSIAVGNNNTNNGGSSSGTTTGRTIQVGNISFTSTATDTASTSINATSPNNNGYRLQTGTITLNNLVTRTAGQTTTTILNPTTANMTVAAITMGTGNTGIANDGVPVLRLDGTSLDNIVTGAISNASDFATGQVLSLQKQNSSTWTLQGTNSYTGTTAISGGKLLLSSTGSLHASSAVTVSGGALGGTGTVNGTVTVSTTGGIDLRDNAVGNLTLASTLGITGAANANNLSFDLGNNTGTSDSILVAGTTTVTTATSAVITLNQLNGVAGRNATTYTLIGGAGALDAANFAKFTLATTKAFGQTYALVHDLVSDGGTGNLQVTAANAPAGPSAAFWGGAPAGTWGTTGNWFTTINSNTSTGAAPAYNTDVTFVTTTPSVTQGSTTLGADFDINSLTFNTTSTGMTISGSNMLTIEASGGTGINAQNTSGTNTISAKVGLASSQTWTVASGGTLAVSGVVSDFGGGYSLTKDGLGDLNLSGVNTYTGATNITAGILRLDNASALAGTSGVSITSGASLFVRSVSPTLGVNQSLTLNGTGATGAGALVISTSGTTTWNGPVSLGSNSLVLQGGGTGLTIGGAVTLGSNTLTVNQAGATATTISGAISGTGGLTKEGTGSGGLVLTGANTYTGATAINAGTLSLAPSSNFLGGVLLASSAVTLSQGATLLLNATATANAVSSGYSLAAPITLTGGAGTATVRFQGNDQKYVLSGGVTGQSAVAQTLSLIQGNGGTGGDRQDIVISGALADGASSGTLAVTLDFAGASAAAQNAFVNLTGQSTFTGNLIVNNSKLINGGATYAGAWLTIGGERWVGNGTNPGSLETVGTGYLGTGGVYGGNITINTGNGVNGTGITTLSFLSSANQTLNGTISGAGNLRQDGTGTLTLGNANNYTGTTTVTSGKLLINGNSSVANGAVSVTGGTLGGTGTTGGAVSVASGATLSPGASIESLVTGALTMASGSNFVYEAANSGATGADLLGVNGSLTLTNVSLDLSLANAALSAGGWNPGDKLTLISYIDAGAGITSGFAGYTDDTAYTFGSNGWVFNYNDTTAGLNYASDLTGTPGGNAKYVTMTLIPEPSTALLALLGSLAMLRRRR